MGIWEKTEDIITFISATIFVVWFVNNVNVFILSVFIIFMYIMYLMATFDKYSEFYGKRTSNNLYCNEVIFNKTHRGAGNIKYRFDEVEKGEIILYSTFDMGIKVGKRYRIEYGEKSRSVFKSIEIK